LIRKGLNIAYIQTAKEYVYPLNTNLLEHFCFAKILQLVDYEGFPGSTNTIFRFRPEASRGLSIIP